MKKQQSQNLDPPNNTLAVRRERERISRELHDRVIQLLSSVRLRAEVCRRDLKENPLALEKELQAIEATTDKAIAEIRLLLSENQTESDLAAGTLERRLKEEMEIFRARSGMRLDFHCAIGSQSLPYEIERELYFALREGVGNAVRHARASELTLTLSQSGTSYEATLLDNGVGFDASSAEGGSHYGLRGMRERIERIGGQFFIESSPGKGTKIDIRVPIHPEKQPA